MSWLAGFSLGRPFTEFVAAHRAAEAASKVEQRRGLQLMDSTFGRMLNAQTNAGFRAWQTWLKNLKQAEH